LTNRASPLFVINDVQAFAQKLKNVLRSKNISTNEKLPLAVTLTPHKNLPCDRQTPCVQYHRAAAGDSSQLTQGMKSPAVAGVMFYSHSIKNGKELIKTLKTETVQHLATGT